MKKIKKKVADFNQKVGGLFDIFCEDAITRNRVEKHHGENDIYGMGLPVGSKRF